MVRLVVGEAARVRVCAWWAWLVRAGDKGVGETESLEVEANCRLSHAAARATLVHTPRKKGNGVVCVVRVQG